MLRHTSIIAPGTLDCVEIRVAQPGDRRAVAGLLWLHASADERRRQSEESFADDFAAWWSSHFDSHLAFVARVADHGLVGMAWLALLPRVPRPGDASRRSADIQSVFVLPQFRGAGLGSALVRAATAHAVTTGATRVTVSSGRRAVPLYRRLGFEASDQLLQQSVNADPGANPGGEPSGRGVGQ
ncbi:GNAT family N-acetyltransferase [Flexivirga caeni]|uniref:GNAT family N-acetyltransferase n=1 Tax=Flexivirga caeni TaxID=2294115 RepID=A0A3M9M3M9_9MICO|nr:GNAT family N-acetyltransferase [Flexivirga caeni]